MEGENSFQNSALCTFEQTTSFRVKIINAGEDSANVGGNIALYPDGSSEDPLYFSVKLCPNFTPGLFKELCDAPKSKSSMVLITSYVSPVLAKQLRKNHVQFIDLAGNTYIQRSNFLIYVVGNSPPDSILTGYAHSFFTVNKLWVLLFVLYKRDLVSCTMRDIAQQSGVSHTTVSGVMTFLKKNGFILDRGRRGREIVERKKIVEIWARMFNEVVRPSVVLGLYSSSSVDWEHDVTLPSGTCWGGDLALNEQATKQNYSDKVIIYTDELPLWMFSQYDIRPNPHGNIEVVKATMTEKINVLKSGAVHPAFLIADLLSCDSEQCQALAEELLDREL